MMEGETTTRTFRWEERYNAEAQDIRRRRRFFVLRLRISFSLSPIDPFLCFSALLRSSPLFTALNLFFSLPVIPGKASGSQLLCATKLHFSTQSQA